jgi:hypothetical protein
MQTDNTAEYARHGRLLAPDNPLFNLARSGRLRLPQSWLEKRPVLINKILYPLAVLLFAFLAPQISAVLGLPLAIMGFTLDESQPDLGFALILIGSFLPLFFLVWLWLRVVEQRPLWTTGMTRPVAKPYLRGLGIGLLFSVSTVLLLGLFGFLEIENTSQNQGIWITLGGTFLVLLGWIVQAAAEEILARGFLLPILGVRWGPAAGVIVSSLFFSVLHLANPNLSFISLVNLFLFGLFAALYALNEGGLWGVFALHAIWNWAQGNLFGFSVSGMNTPSSILFDLIEVGPDWATGGLFGPEGGVVVTLVLLIGIFVLVYLSRRNARNKLEVPANSE